MRAQHEDPSDEVERLRRCMNDLASLLALSETSSDGEPFQIVGALLAGLLDMLSLDFVYARIKDAVDGTICETIRLTRSGELMPSPQEVGASLARWLGDDPLQWAESTGRPFGGANFSIVPLRLGPKGEIGAIVAGSHRVDFPRDTERLLLSVATNQAAIRLQEAGLLRRQALAASELDRRVVQRTAELSAANRELQTEVAEHRRAQDFVRAPELDARKIVDSIPALIALMTPTGNVEIVNEQVVTYFGRSFEEMKNWRFSDAVHPDELQHVTETFGVSLATGQLYEIEHRLRRFDGVYRWFQARGLPLRDTNGQIVRWYVLLTDIDERKRASEAVQASERRLRLIFDGLPALVTTMLPDGRLHDANQHVLDYFGATLDELKSLVTASTFHPDDREAVYAAWMQSIETGVPFDFEGRQRRADGVYRWFHMHGFPWRDQEGRIVLWYLTQIDVDNLRQTEEALRISERTLKLIIDTIPALAWSTRPDGLAEFFNQNYRDYVGLSQEQLQGTGWTVAVHPQDLSGLIAAWQQMLSADAGGVAEARLRRFDGEYRRFLFRTSPLRDEHGHTVKWYGVNADIEDLKRAEERTRLTIETAMDAVITMNAEGEITSWNKQAETVFGWSSQDALGRRVSEVIIPEKQRAAHEQGLRRFLASGEGLISRQRLEAAAVRRNGEEFPIELQVVPMKMGLEWIFSAFIRDITDSKLATEKLRESELNLRQLTETIPQMLWSASPEGMIEYCNERLLNYTGLTRADIKASGWSRFLHPDDVDQTILTWMSCIASGTPYRVEVRAYHAADGAYRWCVANARPLLDHDGHILKWHGAVEDMHDWKHAQEELRNTQEELAHMTRVMTIAELTASIAHEVNQPLSGIITNASTCLRMLAGDPPNIEGARETARRTIRDGNRASDVITRLRALYSKKATASEPMDLNEATHEVIALLLTEFQRSGVIVLSEQSDDLPLVSGDRVQLQQVILNLLRNASEAMLEVHDRPRQMVIRTARDGDQWVQLTVQDSGGGLDPQSVSKLFEPFYTTKKNGMGIGLSLSRSIIESHRGRLWAVPNTDGPGATFAFSIPSSPDAALGEAIPVGTNEVRRP